MNREAFMKQGFVLLPQALDSTQLQQLENAYSSLSAQAQATIDTVTLSEVSYADFYRDNADSLIVVPEVSDPSQVCRFEYLAGSSAAIANGLVPLLQQQIQSLMGEDFVLFKDKCNVKNPGGGAFSPHQDIPAYSQFGPQYHVTAAVILDDSTIENGCLEMAVNYQSALNLSELTVLPFEDGGPNNGDIQPAITEQLDWQPIETKRGDVILFGSYVPHRSQPNHSNQPRRNCFFTFNRLADGDLYERYYQTKRARYGDPMFHISTPTIHDALEAV